VAKSHVRVYISFVSDVFLLLDIVFVFYSDDLVLDHVIKLFIVLYHALKHGDLGWMLCVWTVVLLFCKGSQKGQNERTAVLEWHAL